MLPAKNGQQFIFSRANPFQAMTPLGEKYSDIHKEIRMKKYNTGELISAQTWQDAYGRELAIPSPRGFTHLQFRRYSGCAICNLHLQSFIKRAHELHTAGIQEVVIFNSTQAGILADITDCSFPIIADPHRYLYAQFGVDTSAMAVLNPAVWLPAVRGAVQFGVQLPRDNETPAGLPADFLIRNDGKIIATHYGKHANDQWSIEELLALVHQKELPA